MGSKKFSLEMKSGVGSYKMVECAIKEPEVEDSVVKKRMISNLQIAGSTQKPIEFNQSSLYFKKIDIVGNFLLNIDLNGN